MKKLTDMLTNSIEIYINQRGSLSNPEVVIQVKNMDEARALQRTLLDIRNKRFIAHLERCSTVVADWPAWKRRMLRSGT
jgi:hypothetical protein